MCLLLRWSRFSGCVCEPRKETFGIPSTHATFTTEIMKLEHQMLFLTQAAALVHGVAALSDPQHSTLQLSEPRRAVAAASADGVVVFAGGCGPDTSTFVCDYPTDIIDVFKPSNGGFARDDSNNISLSTARGWPTACSAGGVIAILGGGKEGQKPHSRVLDLYDTSTQTISSNATSLQVGLWGHACATVGDDIYFAGGKVISQSLQPSMSDQVSRLAAGADGKPRLDGLEQVAKLSLDREAAGATNWGDKGFLVAGGTGNWPPIDVPIVDAFTTPVEEGATPCTWNLNPMPPSPLNEYWLGAAAWNDTVSYIMDNKTLYAVNSDSAFCGQSPTTNVTIPFVSGVPAARMPGNGVLVDGVGVCFYSAVPSSLVCYGPDQQAFGNFACDATHVSGGITATGKTVFVGGGVDLAGKITDVVDVFTFE